MTVTVYHMSHHMTCDEMFAITNPEVADWEARMADGTYTDLKNAAMAAAAVAAFKRGDYLPAAAVEGNRHQAWTLTNNIDPDYSKIERIPENMRNGRSADEIRDLLERAEEMPWDKTSPEMRYFGGLLSSWSRVPGIGVTVLGFHSHLGNDDELYGRRSSMVGDLMEEDGKFYMIASIGYEEIEGLTKEDAERVHAPDAHA